MSDQIYKFAPEEVWFTSDTHFGHENIIRYCNRPFRNAEQMNAELIRHWRETVPDDGIVFHLGDFAHGGSYRDVWQLFGHVHSGPGSHTGLDHPRLRMLFPLQYDVGVDNNDFRPISFAQVKAKIEAQVAAAKAAAGIKDDGPVPDVRKIVFLDSGTRIGPRPLDDFRYVPIEAGSAITMADVEAANKIL